MAQTSFSWVRADLVSTTTDPGTPEPLLEGEYIDSSSSDNSLLGVAPGTGVDAADYEYSFQQIDLSQPTTQFNSWKNSTWYGTTTYYEQTIETTPKKNINTNSIPADRPININFVGLDAGDPNQQVSVSREGDLLIDGSMQNAAGSTTLSTSGGSIDAANIPRPVGGQNITLTAANGIGVTGPLLLNLTSGATPTNPNPGTLNATSTKGDINLNDVSGSMRVGKITTSQIRERHAYGRRKHPRGQHEQPGQGGAIILTAISAPSAALAPAARPMPPPAMHSPSTSTSAPPRSTS